jgi:hypothetical protein
MPNTRGLRAGLLLGDEDRGEKKNTEGENFHNEEKPP